MAEAPKDSQNKNDLLRKLSVTFTTNKFHSKRTRFLLFQLPTSENEEDRTLTA